MLDQSFSAHNFEIIFNMENRKGNVDISSMSEAYQHAISRIKDNKERCKVLKRKKKADRTEEECEEIEQLESEMTNLQQEKAKALADDLASIADEVNGRNFTFSMDKHLFKDKEEFTLNKSRASFYAMKQLMYNMKRAFKIEMPGRHQIMTSIKPLLNMKMPIFIVRTDIKSFYESIPQDKLLNKVYDNGLLSFKSKSFIKQVFQEYERIKNTSLTSAGKGVPRGIGISAMLSEVYMQDIDRKLKSRTGVIFYARYVDDIFIITTSIYPFDNIDAYYKNLQEEFKCFGLTLQANDSKKYKLVAYHPDSFKPVNFEYLGYRLNMSETNNGLKTMFLLSKDKKDKIKKRIDNAFLHFETLSKKDVKAARRDLLDSLDYITGNFRLSNAKGRAKVGLYYNSNLIDAFEDLEGFTKSLHHRTISPYDGLFADPSDRQRFIDALKKRICKIDFTERWKERKMCDFSLNRIAEISSWL